MTAEELKAFKQAYDDYPSQDNEGYIPDRGGFKAGFMAGIRWAREDCAKIAENYGAQLYGYKLIAQAIRARNDDSEKKVGSEGT